LPGNLTARSNVIDDWGSDSFGEQTEREPTGVKVVNRGNRPAVPNVEVEVPVEETPDEYAWMFHARCRGISPAEFFPSDGTGVETAQRVCASCPVRSECLEYALFNRIEHGVWGGASERERRRILRRRRDVATTPQS
jgi:WhiB family transcriptional regulator, redox-sensing transcriptional regulator